MSKKLTTITPQYHSFVPDQVLTDKGLNELIDYFEDQTRLSRICLSGVGLACGFEVSSPQDGSSITITQGAAVTTDGDLLHFIKDDGNTIIDIPSLTFSNYYTAAYDNSDNPYEPQFWYDLGGTPTQLSLLELVPDYLNITTDVTPVGDLDLSQFIVLLYLDCKQNAPDSCSNVSCDNQGIEEFRKLRVLLVNKDAIGNAEDSIQHIIESDTLFNASNVVYDYLNNVTCFSVPRVILDEDNTNELVNLASDYHNSMTANSNISNLQEGFDIMLNHVGMTTENGDIQTKLGELFSASQFGNTLFQYRYDLLKDIVDSYCELKELFIEHYSVCCPDIHAFPKHIMLGLATGSDVPEGDNPYRHPFYKSPILDCGEDVMARFQAIVQRVKISLENYIGSTPVTNDIKITPSRFRSPLGKKAIPFYYNITTDSDELIKIWDFDRSRYERYLRIQGYRQAYYSSNPEIVTPLEYNLEPYNFFRIEGHQGWLYQDALEAITTIKDQNGLAFDIKALGINIDEAAEVDVEEYACDFQDLGILLDAWRSEQLCTLGEVSFILSGFSTTEEGTNVNEQVSVTRPPAVKADLNLTSPISDPCAPDRFTTDNVFVKKLTVEENTLGKIVGDAMVKYSGKDSDALYVYVQQEIEKLPIGTWNQASIDATLTLPGKILASSYILTELIPETVQELDSEALINYTNEIDKLCTYTKQLQSKYADGTLELSDNIMALIDLLNNQLTNICCSSQKLQALFQEVIDRKLEVLTRLKFSVFAKEHSGLEHLAGVEPGGTFVMVYVFAKNDSGDATNTISVPSGTVVADFSLPYLCCSDCAPINFVVPKPVVSLSLPTDLFCLDKEVGTFIFNVSPADGTIETTEKISGVEIKGTELRIDPATFDINYFNIPIGFTVNGQITNAFITVRPQPHVSFDATINKNVVAFTPNGDISNSQFNWDFGDGSTSNNSNPTHTYELPVPQQTNSQPGDLINVPVTLNVIPESGGCTGTVTKDIPMPGVRVTLDKTTFCIGDDPYPFKITPDYATPVLEGTGVTADGKYFDPALTAGKTGPFEITFLGDVIAKVIVDSIPESSIRGTYYETGLDLSYNYDTGTGLKPTGVLWEFFDAQTDTKILEDSIEVNPRIEFSLVPDPTNLKVRMTLGFPCGDAKDEAIFRMPPY